MIQKVNKILKFARKDNIYYYCINLFIITIFLKPNYSNIGLIVLCLGFILTVKQRHLLFLFKNVTWQILFAFICFYSIRLIPIEQELLLDYLDNYGKYLIILVLPVILSPSVDFSLRMQRRLLLNFSLALLLGSVICLVSALYFEESNFFKYGLFTIPIGGIHPAYMSSFCCLAVFILIKFGKSETHLSKIIFYFLSTLILVFSIFILKARTPLLIMLFLSILCVLYYAFKNSFIKRTIPLLVLIFVIITLLVVIFETQYLLLKARILDSFLSTFRDRIDLWKCVYTSLEGSSWIFGVGTGKEQIALNNCYCSNFMTRPYFEQYNAHNGFLQILLMNGIIGLFIWLIFIYKTVQIVLKRNNLLALVFLFIFLIGLLTEVYFNRIWGALFFGTFYSLFIIMNFDIKQEALNQK